MDREFRVQKALAASAVPVAGMHVLCEDDDVIGSAFYVMDHVDGGWSWIICLDGSGAMGL